MTFETAIFFDLENLFKGYNFTTDFLSNLSLKDITRQITSLPHVERLAIQRAYANWSDPRLSLLRSDIVELGIDPIQVFGFSKGPQKNAADVQLAIDAMEILHTRSFLKTFVIVSGDGAFAALARKLHEYGKIVIGCAYRNAANKVFEAVCDRFLWLEEPPSLDSTAASSSISDPRIHRMTRRIRPLEHPSPDEIYKKTREVFQWLLSDPECSSALRDQGLYLSPLREALSYAIPSFLPQKLGWAKFVKFLQFASKDTPLAVFLAPPSEVKVALSTASLSGFQRLPNLDESHTHTEENYRELLLCDAPIFRLPSRDIFQHVATALLRFPTDRLPLKTWIETLASCTSLDAQPLKAALFCLLSAGCFLREPLSAPVAEQTLALLPSLADHPSSLLASLRKAVESKLASYLPRIDSDLLDLLIPNLSSSSPPSLASSRLISA